MAVATRGATRLNGRDCACYLNLMPDDIDNCKSQFSFLTSHESSQTTNSLSLAGHCAARSLSLFTVDTVTSSHIRPTTLSPSNVTHKKPKWHMLAHG